MTSLLSHLGDRLKGGELGIPHDVPVIMQPEFQQSFLFVFLEVPRIQFKMRVLKLCRTCSAVLRCGCGRARCCSTTGAGNCSLSIAVDIPVVAQRLECKP